MIKLNKYKFSNFFQTDISESEGDIAYNINFVNFSTNFDIKHDTETMQDTQ